MDHRLQSSLPLALAATAFLSSPAHAEKADDWLTALYEDAAEDLSAGKPLVAQVHVPLCDNNVIWCGNDRLGDGDTPATNLYWATSGGFRGWFKRATGWQEVEVTTPADSLVLERRVWKKRVRPGRSWRARGVKKPFDVYIVAFAWRGQEIGEAMEAYATDLYGDTPRHVALEGDTVLAAGGAAHVVAYVGHNGWMDVSSFDWKRPAAKKPKGAIAIACLTADYLAAHVPDETRVPLLLTTSLMFAGAHSLEGAVSAFSRGEPLSTIRRRAAENHARGQKRPLRAGLSVFTNPSDRRWKRYTR